MSERKEYRVVTGGGPLLLALAIRQLHSERRYSGDGYGWSVCAECRQAWPCATEQAIQSVEAIPGAPKRGQS